jgi:hypothetical protein
LAPKYSSSSATASVLVLVEQSADALVDHGKPLLGRHPGRRLDAAAVERHEAAAAARHHAVPGVRQARVDAEDSH